MSLRNVTLEMSLKPFKDDTPQTARTVCEHLFTQWLPLLQEAKQVSVLLWCADGSEILDYRADPGAPFEWARYIGGATSKAPVANDPDGVALHSRPYLYMDDPPVFTYGWLRETVGIIKQVGREITGLPVRVGETFDPGPEFAKSPFKYERHPEICMGDTMGAKSFVCAYATLHADPEPYAGFPDGIEEGTPLGTFLGRQAQCFLTDLGFDYLWLSNGFGFGLEPWALRGAVFDGERFSTDRVDEVRALNLAFWDAFRAECPDFPVETRGTNLSTAMDLSSDAVPLRDIYAGGYGIEPPPNSPWAALNRDFGIELVGWMSHIAELPGESFPYRFYTHDPWWLNSPWLDRYGREPHDIYLPLAVARIDARGETRTPDSMLFLTADDSYGNLPDQVPQEVIPHLLSGHRDRPDAPGLITWVYPFDEYHDWTFGSPPRIEEVFFGDWFMRGALNQGLPANTVMSTASLVAVVANRPEILRETLLLSPVPSAGSEWEKALLGHVDSGGQVVLYGPLTGASETLLSLLGIELGEPLEGEFALHSDLPADLAAVSPPRVMHHALLSAGGICEKAVSGLEPAVRLLQDGLERAGAAIMRRENGGALGWVRGTVACDPGKVRGHLLTPLDRDEYYPMEALLRQMCAALGAEVLVERREAEQLTPMLCMARHANGFFLSGYNPDNTVIQHLRLPQGAPLMVGMATRLLRGRATYTMPPAWHRECRVFIEQAGEGLVSCHEQHSGDINTRRRLIVRGLDAATVRFYPEVGTVEKVAMLRNPAYPYLVGDFVTLQECRDRWGHYLEARDVTGDVLISW